MVLKKSECGSRSDGMPGVQFVKQSELLTLNNSKKKKFQRNGMTKINEHKQESFDKEKFKRRNIDIYDNEIDNGNFEAAPPTATSPPLQRSVDLIPIEYSNHQESNITLDQNSIFSRETETASELYDQNFNDEGTIRTTSTMMTAQIRNIDGRQNQSDDRLSTIMNNATHENHQQSRKVVRKRFERFSNVNQLMIDTQGRAISDDEIKSIWMATGKCIKCGVNTTHQKQKCGPFGMFRRMTPQTEEGKSYKGVCLYCHDVPMLRIILHEPDIPLDLPRYDLRQSSLYMIQLPQDGISEILDVKQSPVVTLCSSMRFQMCCFLVVLLFAGALVLIGIKVAKKPDIWISPPPSLAPSSSPSTHFPSASPTLYSWNFHSEIISDYASFGQKIKLSKDGSVLAVSSPYFENGRGRFDIYTTQNRSNKTTWTHLLPVYGTKVKGISTSDLMSHGMSLSADGSTVAIGSPGYGNGLVDVYIIDPQTSRIAQKGNSILGPAPLSEFGFSLALNSLGTRLFVGAPNYGLSDAERIGIVRAYDYNNSTNSWIQVGSDITGVGNNSRFGHSIASSYDGSKIIVGAPFDSTKFEHAGKIYCFTLDKDLNLWYHFPYNHFYGDSADSQLGFNLAASNSGEYFISSVETSSYEEEYKGAGVLVICFIGTQFNTIDTVGYPISGTHEDAHLGCQIDMNDFGSVVIASEKHLVDTSGTVRAYMSINGIMEPYGSPIPGFPLGSCQPRGRGPSVSIVTRPVERLAIGYECLFRNGQIKSAVHVYDFHATSG
jgi:hypothetical protein